MRLGIMQPYFFPYLGHFALIASADKWIVFDVTQYTPKTWMSRNRVLHPKAGWQYITVPLSNASISIKTAEAKVLDLAKTKKSIQGKLSHYRKSAPYFHEVNCIVQQTFDNTLDDSLVSLNVSGLIETCSYLNIPFSYQVCSELELEYPPEPGPGDWAPFICQSLGASEYVNPVGGKDLFDTSKFQGVGVSLFLAEHKGFKYDTSPYGYEPHLSILDVLMWNSPGEIVMELSKKTTLIRAS